jgi:transcriptional regulator with XRE-family HTH domain
VKAIGAKVQRIRRERGLSLSEVAASSSLAKATLANLEGGRGNPTIETLWSLALGLGVPFSDLLEQPELVSVAVVRAGEGPEVRSRGRSQPMQLRLLDRVERGGLTEVFDMTLSANGRQEGRPHGRGVIERLLLFSGRMLAGPAEEPVELGPGDFIRYPADRPHLYQALDGPCRGVLLVEY